MNPDFIVDAVVTPKSRMSLSHKLAAVSRALLDTKVSGLVGPLEPGRLRVLISTAETTRVREVIGSVARAIHDRSQLLTPPSTTVIGAGNPVKSIDELQRSFGEANGAAEAARTLPGDHLFVSTSDIGLRGLVQLFREEPRLRSYAERKLGPIIDYDERNDTDLTATLVAFLKAGGNKSTAAAAVFMNRTTFYHRLLKIEEVLRCDLDSPEVQHSLYVALVMRNML
jgi:purine catabolism regulator